MAYHTIFLLTFILFSNNQAASVVYHITASSADFCDVPCLTLSQVITDAEIDHYYLRSDITMVFLPGTHYLSVNFSLSYLYNLTMKSHSTVAQIVCVGHSHMTFARFQHMHPHCQLGVHWVRRKLYRRYWEIRPPKYKIQGLS